MYAIIETSGKQYKVKEGTSFFTEKQKGYNEGDPIEFDRVVMLKSDDGLKVGKPYLEGTKVVGKIVKNGKGKKIRVIKFRPRKNYDREYGHRQHYSEILVEKIED